MPALDSWLQITVRTSLAAFLLLVLVGLGAGAIVALSRLRARAKEAETLQAERASRTRQAERREMARTAYRHFIYNLSHEVANPLQSIQTHLDNMARSVPGKAEAWQQYHAFIEDEVGRLSRLTDNLRLLAHLEAPDAPVVREPVNLKGVIEEVMMALHDAAEAQDMRLRYVGPERPPRVLGDRDGLHRVLQNLVDNGIKYSQPEGGEVIVSLHAEPDHVAVRVSDEGVGIAKEDLAHIFDTAYRAPTARSFCRQGSGLGLALVKRIVERHGGEIRVQSQAGVGTTFSFELPLQEPS